MRKIQNHNFDFRVRKVALYKNSNKDEPCFISWLACSPQTKDYKISVCCFSTIKHAALRRKSKDWLAQNQDNVSEWNDMSICGLLFQ